MKFVIGKKELLELIGKLQNVVAQKATIPILANFLLEAGNDELILSATDLTVGVRCYTGVKILEEGSTTLPARRFFQLIRELPQVQVEVSVSQDHIAIINAGASHFRLHGMSPTEFPALPDLAGAKKIEFPQEKLRDLLYRTAFAASREDNRYVLTGILCRLGNGRATFVGTDGKLLAKTMSIVDLDTDFSGSYVLPIKAVEEVIRMLTEPKEMAKVYLMPDRVAIEADKTVLITKLLSGEYPQVEQVIPKSSEVNVSLHREELISLLRQVSLFTNDENQSVRFTFTPGELTLTANAMDVGGGEVNMPVNYQGDKLEIAFNPTYFLDILRHVKNEETVHLGLTDAFNPGVIADEGEGTFVIMPMRLGD